MTLSETARDICKQNYIGTAAFGSTMHDIESALLKVRQDTIEECAVVADKVLAPTEYAERYSATIAQAIRSKKEESI